MNPKEDQSGVTIAPAAQVHAYAPTKNQKESYSFHEQPYFKMPSWQKMTVAVSRTWHERTSKWKWKTRVRQSEMAKGNDQERRGELDSTMASKNNCKGERQ
jgi:hypothetical protein